MSDTKLCDYRSSDCAGIGKLVDGKWYCGNHIPSVTPDPRIEAAKGMAEALRDAAESLNTLATQAGKDEYLHDIYQIRGYAHSRATVARAALAAWEQAQ